MKRFVIRALRLAVCGLTLACGTEGAAQAERPPAPSEKGGALSAGVAGRFRDFKLLVTEKMNAGLDVSAAHALAAQANAAAQQGDEQQALRLLDQAIGLLNGVTPAARTTDVIPDRPAQERSPPDVGPPARPAGGSQPAPAAAPRPYDDSPFGMEEARANELPDPLQYAREIGVRWLYPLYFRWDEVQRDRSRARYDWSHPLKGGPSYDRLVADVPADMHLVGSLLNTDADADPRASYVPANVAQWVAFVQATVARYNGDGVNDMPGLRSPIKYWQVGSEPGLGKQYHRLLEITYRVIKAADPQAQVVIGAWVCGPGLGDDIRDFCQPCYEDWVRPLSGPCFDVFDLHWYPNARADYKRFKAVYDYWRRALDAKGFRQVPIWSTGIGTYSGTPKVKVFVHPGEPVYHSEEFQAADLLKQYVYYLALGVQKIFLAMGMKEGGGNDPDRLGNYFEMTGLMFDGVHDHDRGAGVKKVGYYTYQMMTEKLEGSDWGRIEEVRTGASNVHAYRFHKRAGGHTVLVAWWDWFMEMKDPAGKFRNVSLPCAGTQATVTLAVTDYAGRRTVSRQQPVGGVLNLVLGESPVFVEE